MCGFFAELGFRICFDYYLAAIRVLVVDFPRIYAMSVLNAYIMIDPLLVDSHARIPIIYSLLSIFIVDFLRLV